MTGALDLPLITDPAAGLPKCAATSGLGKQN